MTLSRDSILRMSNNGLLYFQKRFKSRGVTLNFIDEHHTENIDSEFHEKEGTLSIFFNPAKGVWYFKDWYGEELYGDVFSYVAFALDLDFRKDFRKILKHILDTLNEKDDIEAKEKNLVVTNKENGQRLYFHPDKESVKLVKESFSNYFPSLQLQDEIRAVAGRGNVDKTRENNNVYLSNDKAPLNNLFAIKAGPTAYYLITVPEFKVSLWGIKNDRDILGLKEALHIAFFSYPIGKENLVVCDSLVNTLCFLSIGIAAVYVPFESLQSAYFKEIIVSSFKNIIIAYEKSIAKILREFKSHPFAVFNLKEFLETKSISPLPEYIKTVDNDVDFFTELFDLFIYNSEEV